MPMSINVTLIVSICSGKDSYKSVTTIDGEEAMYVTNYGKQRYQCSPSASNEDEVIFHSR